MHLPMRTLAPHTPANSLHHHRPRPGTSPPLSEAGLESAHISRSEQVFEYWVAPTDEVGDEVHPGQCDPFAKAASDNWVELSRKVVAHL